MPLCVLCAFEVPLDDVAVDLHKGDRCLCLKCVLREAGAPLRVPAALRREINRESD